MFCNFSKRWATVLAAALLCVSVAGEARQWLNGMYYIILDIDHWYNAQYCKGFAHVTSGDESCGKFFPRFSSTVSMVWSQDLRICRR